MCFIFSDRTKRLVAKRDVQCYKVLDHDFAPYHYFQYTAGKVYTLSQHDRDEATCEWSEHPKNGARRYISIGFHSFATVARAYAMAHSYNEERTMKRTMEVYSATIPAGAEYFTNDHGDVVSSSIRIDEVAQRS